MLQRQRNLAFCSDEPALCDLLKILRFVKLTEAVASHSSVFRNLWINLMALTNSSGLNPISKDH